jgi:uncharacterized RDD family membrane protein YckC
MEHCMSSTEPPAGSTPPEEPTPPPPPPPAGAAAPPPPTNPGTYPPPPPPPAGAAPAAGVPGAAYGPGQPGNLLDRFLARLIDGIIVGIVVGIIYGILNAATSYWTGLFINGIVGAVLFTGYFAYMESNRGQTIGKQVMKLRTVGPDGQSNPTMNEAIKRNIYYTFGIVPCLGGLAELIAAILIAVQINSDPQRQHLFDRFADGTRVLKVG